MANDGQPDTGRRDFLGAIGGAAIGLAFGSRQLSALSSQMHRPSKLDRIGIQLYTVRKHAQADLAGTLARLAKIGFKEVELAGLYNHSAGEFRDLLKANGLAAPSAHVAIEQFENDTAKTLNDAQTLGLQWITAPSLPRGSHVTVEDWKKVAAQFNSAGQKAKSAGFKFAFHNHNDIVKQTGDVMPIEILMAETDPALVSYQMDIFWAVSGGADPLALLAKHPGRFTMFHVKDGRAPFTDPTQTDIGQGTIDFRPIFAKAQGIRHYFMESDSAVDPMAFAASGYKYLSNLSF